MSQKRIVLLHGWGASIKKLEPLRNELEKTEWEVLMPKLPGFDAPDPDTPWSLNDYSSFVIKTAGSEWKDKSYYIFGHSFGGRVATKIAAQKKANLVGIVLCASGGVSRGSLIKRFSFYVVAKAGKLLLISPPIARLFRTFLYKIAQEHDYEKSNPVMKKTMQNVIEEDIKELLPKIKVRTLILWGKQDKVTPYEDAEYLNGKIKSSKLVSFSDQGHKLPYNLPEEISREINKWIT